MWDLLEEGLAMFGPGEHSRRLLTTTAKTPAKKSCLRGFSHFRGAECKLIEIAIKNPKTKSDISDIFCEKEAPGRKSVHHPQASSGGSQYHQHMWKSLLPH